MVASAIRIDIEAIYPLPVAAQVTGISRSALLTAIKNRELQARKRGVSWFISGRELQSWLAPKPQTATQNEIKTATKPRVSA